ncbi:MAG: DsrE/DsrF/DrsH-like family protein [Candidatus Methanofastidiosa archaeon]|jgi:peroxiredoxin family protein|nr:DsrE/DsrF/DrsH-like family protein [Candidatus Methanofastidiosa archaeon]
MTKMALIVFSGELDKALATFVLATGAAASGWDVTLFFTFWGINIVRSENKCALEKKDVMSKMFGAMMPKGCESLPLSNMHMMGLGTSMMKKRMKGKRVKSLKEMIADAKELGVKFLVCDMSMDVMGLQKEEFIDEVDEIVGVGTYLKEAKDAQVTLFI